VRVTHSGFEGTRPDFDDYNGGWSMVLSSMRGMRGMRRLWKRLSEPHRRASTVVHRPRSTCVRPSEDVRAIDYRPTIAPLFRPIPAALAAGVGFPAPAPGSALAAAIASMSRKPVSWPACLSALAKFSLSIALK
jgi:hypothetical protein